MLSFWSNKCSLAGHNRTFLPTQTLERLCMTTHQYRLVNYTKSVAESTAYCSHFAIRQQGHIMFLSVTELGCWRINLQMKVWAVNLLLLFKYWVEKPEHAQYDPSAHPPLIHTQIHSAGTPQFSSPPELIKGLIESIIGLIALSDSSLWCVSLPQTCRLVR